jgi:hypothetical protein
MNITYLNIRQKFLVSVHMLLAYQQSEQIINASLILKI